MWGAIATCTKSFSGWGIWHVNLWSITEIHCLFSSFHFGDVGSLWDVEIFTGQLGYCSVFCSITKGRLAQALVSTETPAVWHSGSKAAILALAVQALFCKQCTPFPRGDSCCPRLPAINKVCSLLKGRSADLWDSQRFGLLPAELKAGELGHGTTS